MDNSPVAIEITKLITAGVTEGQLIATVARHYIEQRIQFSPRQEAQDEELTMDVTPSPEFMLAWCRTNHKGVEKKQTPPEEFFRGCETAGEKHARVAALYPDAYQRVEGPKKRACVRTKAKR